MFVNTDKNRIKDNLFVFCLVFTWHHPSKPVEETSKNMKVKITHSGSHICLFSHVPHAVATVSVYMCMYICTVCICLLVYIIMLKSLYTIAILLDLRGEIKGSFYMCPTVECILCSKNVHSTLHEAVSGQVIYKPFSTLQH